MARGSGLYPARGEAYRKVPADPEATWYPSCPAPWLFQHAMSQVARFLAWREGADPNAVDESRVSLLAYFQLVWRALNSNHGNLHNLHEMRNIAVAVDHLLGACFEELGDHLVQRFKALERFAQDGHWAVAQHMELGERPEGGLTGADELQEAGRSRLFEDRLAKTVSKPGGASR